MHIFSETNVGWQQAMLVSRSDAIHHLTWTSMPRPGASGVALSFGLSGPASIPRVLIGSGARIDGLRDGLPGSETFEGSVKVGREGRYSIPQKDDLGEDEEEHPSYMKQLMNAH